MIKYIIMKSSMNFEEANPYSGPACAHAGIPDGQIYDSCEMAEHDKFLLNQFNPVGFNVLQIELKFIKVM